MSSYHITHLPPGFHCFWLESVVNLIGVPLLMIKHLWLLSSFFPVILAFAFLLRCVWIWISLCVFCFEYTELLECADCFSWEIFSHKFLNIFSAPFLPSFSLWYSYYKNVCNDVLRFSVNLFIFLRVIYWSDFKFSYSPVQIYCWTPLVNFSF